MRPGLELLARITVQCCSALCARCLQLCFQSCLAPCVLTAAVVAFAFALVAASRRRGRLRGALESFDGRAAPSHAPQRGNGALSKTPVRATATAIYRATDSDSSCTSIFTTRCSTTDCEAVSCALVHHGNHDPTIATAADQVQFAFSLNPARHSMQPRCEQQRRG
jgi:hypothetical protein